MFDLELWRLSEGWDGNTSCFSPPAVCQTYEASQLVYLRKLLQVGSCLVIFQVVLLFGHDCSCIYITIFV
jgi:hypothetical protein